MRSEGQCGLKVVGSEKVNQKVKMSGVSSTYPEKRAHRKHLERESTESLSLGRRAETFLQHQSTGCQGQSQGHWAGKSPMFPPTKLPGVILTKVLLK